MTEKPTFAKVSDTQLGNAAPQRSDRFDIGKEASAVTYGTPSTLNDAENKAYEHLRDAKGQEFANALNTLSSLANGNPEKVAGRLLFHLAHGPESENKKNALLAVLKKFPDAANMQLNGKDIALSSILKGKTFNDFSDDKVDIPRWSNDTIAKVQAIEMHSTAHRVPSRATLPQKPSDPIKSQSL